MPATNEIASPSDRVVGLAAAGAEALAAAGVGNPRLDAELLLAAACGGGRTRLYTHPEEPVPAAARRRYETWLARRARREPLQYILGRQEFWSLDFAVTPAVLIPRPETERLVELALRHVPAAQRPRLCDVGTGSGCLAVALATELPQAEIHAVDTCAGALALARRNAERHGVDDRIRFIRGDLLEPVAQLRFDLVVSNPPYLSSTEVGAAQPELDWEPRAALDGGADGLAVLRRLLAALPGVLAAGGVALVEIGSTQAGAAIDLALDSGLRPDGVESDAAGLPRVLLARK